MYETVTGGTLMLIKMYVYNEKEGIIMKKTIIGILLSIIMINVLSAHLAFADSYETHHNISEEYSLPDNSTDTDNIDDGYTLATDSTDFENCDDLTLYSAASPNNTRLTCNKLYRIKTTKGYCVAMPSDTFGVDGARARLERVSNGKINQWWYVLPGDSSNFCLVNFATGKTLEVTGASRYNDAQIGQWSVAPRASNQRWKLKYVNSRYVALYNVGTGKVMDIPYSNQYEGQIVNQYEYNGCTAQQFAFVSVSTSEYRSNKYSDN